LGLEAWGLRNGSGNCDFAGRGVFGIGMRDKVRGFQGWKSSYEKHATSAKVKCLRFVFGEFGGGEGAIAFAGGAVAAICTVPDESGNDPCQYWHGSGGF